MSKTYLYSDPHFGHANILVFKRADGTKLRPWDRVDQMDRDLCDWWNEIVRPEDKVYVLGDVAMNPKHLWWVTQLKGDKVLIKGNHDQAKLSKYAKLFRDVRSYWQLGRCLLSHIPIHPGSLSRWRANIHGHLHYQDVLDAHGKPDPRYINVSVEKTNYRPILLEEVLAKVPNDKK